jgi:hypothetical protein
MAAAAAPPGAVRAGMRVTISTRQPLDIHGQAAMMTGLPSSSLREPSSKLTTTLRSIAKMAETLSLVGAGLREAAATGLLRHTAMTERTVPNAVCREPGHIRSRRLLYTLALCRTRSRCIRTPMHQQHLTHSTHTPPTRISRIRSSPRATSNVETEWAFGSISTIWFPRQYIIKRALLIDFPFRRRG